MKIAHFYSFLAFVACLQLAAQKQISTYIFGHSLLHHEFQLIPTPTQETSVPHWFQLLADEAGHDYSVSGQYGFLPQHDNLPPSSNWYFELVDSPWDSEIEPFSAAGFNTVLLTPGNFIQWQGPTVNYPDEPVSPFSATSTIFNWCDDQDDSLVFYIYENWPDMGGYLANGFPPAQEEWSTYNNYLNGDFHDWFIEYHDLLIADLPNACVRMIPAGPIISSLLQQAPYNQIPFTELYEDDAPHGRPTTYFLASLITYMSMYEEKAPATYEPNEFIHPIVADNYEDIVDFIWEELANFSDDNGDSRVFCSTLDTGIEEEQKLNTTIQFWPNPVGNRLSITGITTNANLHIYDFAGSLIASCLATSFEEIDLSKLPEGLYLAELRNESGSLLQRQKLLKQ
ncbi:T9SS type A sorting domain-containing protein [Chitinophagales bacterium]|nr:T9SS type A sorting domain-containing protein [Chitinophagales bacterium]